MSSILTNSAALSALQSLNMTQQALQTTQNQVSSGLAVANASDNAAYWSVGQQLKADSGIATASNTALAQSQAVLSTANSAIQSVITTINAINTALTQATNPGANLTNINTMLASLSSQLTDAINGASFNGQNLLNNNNANSFVSGFDSQSGSVTSISMTSQALTGGSTGGTSGAFVGTVPTSVTSATTGASQLASITSASDISSFFGLAASGTQPATPTANGAQAILGGLATTGAVTISTSDAQGNVTTTTYQALDANGAAMTTAANASAIASLSVFRATTNAGDVTTGLLTQTGATSAQGPYNLTRLGTGGTAVTAANATDMLSAVGQALSAVTNYAATIGATQNRMTAMSNFNDALTTNYANGVSALVDANMNTAPTRLQALQTQQQLGIQSLSIANQNAQLILKLFG
jgi:flagellin